MEQAKYELLSLDLWDTVIRRKCHPDEIKDKTSDFLMTNYYEYINENLRAVELLTKERIRCEREIGTETSKNGFDDEYEIHSVFDRWISVVMPQYIYRTELVEELYGFELNTEIKNAFLDSDIISVIESIPHKKLAYVSDFYAGTDFIDAILRAVGCPLKFDGCFISCECGYNKRSGRLFDYVLNKMNIRPESQCHIGDNQYSDVECPKNKGIHTQYFIPEAAHKERLQREKEYLDYKEKNENCKNTIFSLYDDISLFFYGFIHWIIESCIQDGIKKIYFFTREGEFYKKIFDEIVKCECLEKIAPRAEILEVSRLSTFCASLRDITLSEMMRIWNQYSIQSMSALFKSLAIDKDCIKEYIIGHELDWDEVITYPWQDRRVIELFEDENFIKVIASERDKKRKLLYDYMLQKGLIYNQGEKIGIVDIGWRGTIQDNISYLLPNHIIKGFYIGLIPFLNEQPENTIKRGYINGYKKFDLLLKYVMPFEMISNSPNGSTTGYEHKDGKTIAIRKKEEEEDRIFYKYTEKIQKQIVDNIAIISEKTNGKKYIANLLREMAHISLSKYILYPKYIVAEAYFSLRHNEEFGVGEYVDKRTKFKFGLFVKAILGSRHRSELAQFLRDTTWPQGYLVRYHLRPLVKIYNMRYSEE